MAKKKVLVIGWDAADWKVINPLMDAGKMPNLQRLVENGVMGNIATLDPPMSPILWTSIATGKRGDKHGILGFVEPDVENGCLKNISSSNRTTRAFWNILHHEGYKQNIIGWWPSHPVEPINGVMVSNMYQRAHNKKGESWKVPIGAVHPNEIIKEISPLRVHPSELTVQHMLPFIPEMAKMDLENDENMRKLIISLSKMISDTATIHSTATYLMDNTEWDFTAVYYDSIDHFSHGFMRYYPPQIKGIPDNLFELFKDVVKGAYQYHDMMLERLLELAGEDATIILLSDHGFHSDHFRLRDMPKYNAAPALEHNPFGVFVMSGPGIKKDERIYGATLLDVTPTLLVAMGLPVGSDMDGKVLASAFEKQPDIKYIDSWDDVEGDFGEHPEDMKEDSYTSAEALQQLIDLGYIQDPGEDNMKAMREAENDLQLNLAQIYMARRNYAMAQPILEELHKKEPQDIRFSLDLANCYVAFKQFDKVRIVFDEMKALNDDVYNKKFLNIGLLEAKLLLAEKKRLEAMALLDELKKRNPYNLLLNLELGKVYYNLGKYHQSLDVYEVVLKIDQNNAQAYLGKAQNLFYFKKYEEAADNALNAIGLLYHIPMAHFILGKSLFQLQLFQNAAEAFEVTAGMMPRYFPARKFLFDIYENYLKTPEKAEPHKKVMEELMKGRITIVSGLPRSGTSMMMQMLDAGGLEILTDGERQADGNNPKGYYEFQRVKNLAKDKAWLPEAEGKVVKVIAQLLQFLPNQYEYDVIFMDRDMDEVLKSQQIMLGKDPSVYPSVIANSFKKELEKVEAWANSSPAVRLKHVSYKDVIANPTAVAEDVNEFLGYKLDTEKMIETVDPELYRNRG